MKDKCAVLIMAAGKGSRMNSDVRKQYIEINGKSILETTIEKFAHTDFINHIVIICPEDDTDLCRNIALKNCKDKSFDIVAGGKERYDSVYNGLKSLNSEYKYVLIQDGVRPFVSQKIIKDVYEATKIYGAVIPAVKVKDTIKSIDEEGFVENTLERSKIIAVQTPQGFLLEEIIKAYESLIDKSNITDDASIAEAFGIKVKVVEGSYDNIKITTQEDIVTAKGILDKENTYENC